MASWLGHKKPNASASEKRQGLRMQALSFLRPCFTQGATGFQPSVLTLRLS
jgi:hypothetical protein